MIGTIIQHLQTFPDGTGKRILQRLLGYTARLANSCALSNSTLVITATSGKKVPKTGAADSYFSAKGTIVKIAAGTDMPALAGTVTNAKFNVFCFFVDSAGTTTSLMGAEGATLGAVRWPDFPLDKALIGFIIINPTGTGDFVGNTTALDDGTVVPNTVYSSPVGAFDPTFVYT